MTHYFVHIPKTAGTSYRMAFEAKNGKVSVAYDYGENISESSSLIQQGYQTGIYSILNQLREKKLICGHVPITKYSKVVGIKNCFTFLRNPIERCYSDFLHMRRHYGYSGTLQEYLDVPAHQNRLSFFLSGVPFESIGFIGLTESYELSLQMLAYWA